MFVLQSHYRTESNFSWDNLTAAANRLTRWKAIASLRHQTYDTLEDDADKSDVGRKLSEATKKALEALQDDLNTPEAIAAIESAFPIIETNGLARVNQTALLDLLTWIDTNLGFQLLETTPDISEDAKLLLIERSRAREAKDWAKSDEIRDELQKLNITVRDTPHGPVWS